MKNSGLKFLALGGVVGPVFFTVVTVLGASLRPDYNHISQFISELGATGTPNAILMNYAGFILTGVMIIVFGVSLYFLFPKRFIARLGSVLIILFGLGFILVGNISCDPGCPREGSFENTLHDKISGPMFLSAITGMLLLGISFRGFILWRKLWIYSVVSALISFGLVVALINSIEAYILTGMWQRLLLVTIFLWCGIVALRMLKYSPDMEVDKS